MKRLLGFIFNTYIVEIEFNVKGQSKFLQATMTVLNKDTLLKDMVNIVEAHYDEAIDIKIVKLFKI